MDRTREADARTVIPRPRTLTKTDGRFDFARLTLMNHGVIFQLNGGEKYIKIIIPDRPSHFDKGMTICDAYILYKERTNIYIGRIFRQKVVKNLPILGER